MYLAYSNNGLSFRSVDPSWTLGDGEVLFDHSPTDDELSVAFPSYISDKQATEKNKQIISELDDIDYRSSRPIRSILLSQLLGSSPNPADVSKLSDLNARADALRPQLVK